MSLPIKNWTLSNPSPSAWTALITETAILRTLIVANASLADATVQARLTDGPSTVKAMIFTAQTVKAGASLVLDLSYLAVGGGEQVQIQVSGAGMYIIGSGEQVQYVQANR